MSISWEGDLNTSINFISSIFQFMNDDYTSPLFTFPIPRFLYFPFLPFAIYLSCHIFIQFILNKPLLFPQVVFSAAYMGSGHWFKASINLKRLKIRLAKIAIKKWRRKRGQKLNEDIAATRIQAAFRGYMARKALRRLRGTMRFRGILIEGCYYNQQVSATLKHIHSWSRIQTEMKARRLGMVTQGRLKQKKIQNQLKLQAKLHELEVDWSGGSETMEEILQRIQQREEAAIKRERAMAYAYSHQWRANSSHYFGQAYYDLGKDSWGWSWTERWIAVRPWETRVQAKPMNLKREGNNKTTNLGGLKLLVSERSPLSNVKNSPKARKL